MLASMFLKKLIRYAVPVPLKKAMKWALYATLDFVDAVTGKRDPRYPPRRLNFVGSADFTNVGNEFLRHLTTLGRLQPHERVLDIGCGIGRIAIPLATYVKEGSYDGFDIDARGVRWCREHVTPAHPNFRFVHANIFNAYYNAGGDVQAKDYRFPYDDRSFDLAFATSVFTHMLADDTDHYFAELKRVLKPGGRALLTFFLLNPDVNERMRRGQTTANFQYRDPSFPACAYSHKTVKEAETAYDETWVREKLAKHGLANNLVVHRGWWSGTQGVSYQDIVVCEA